MRRRIRRINYQAFGITDVGRKRGNNEDSFLVNKELALFAVADGMGGHERGEIASQTALEVIERVAGNILPASDEDTLREGQRVLSNEALAEELVQKANREIHQKNLAQTGRQKMGTTLVCAIILGGKLYIFNSGDSRCYHMSEGSLHRLTEDHSPAEEMIQSGRATEEDSKVRAIRNRVRGALGVDPDIDPDVVASIPKRGDIYLLCSDGLTGMLSDGKIQTLLQGEADIEKKCKTLVHMANELGGKDNITVVLLEITSVDASLAKEPVGSFEGTSGEPEDTLRDF